MGLAGYRSAVWLWTRSELRRRALPLVLLGVLAGLAGGTAVAAFEGARVSGSAYERMRTDLNAADAVVFPSQVGILDFDPAVLADMPEVAAWGGFSIGESQVDGLPAGAAPIITTGDWFESIEGAQVLQGRLPDPASDTEAVVTEAITLEDLEEFDLAIGPHLVWRNLSFDDLERFPDGLPPDFDWHDATGVVTDLTIVGRVRLPMDSVVAFASDGLLLMGPGWAAQHLDATPVHFTNALVRLQGDDALSRLRADLTTATGRSDIPVKDLATDIKRVQRSLDLEQTALYMFAAAVAMTGVVLVGQALGRATASGRAVMVVLRTMGASSAALLVGLVAPMIVTVAVAAITTLIVAIVASQWFPVGLARDLIADNGVRFAVAVDLGGTAVVAGVLLVGVWLAAWVTVRSQTRVARPRTPVVALATRLGLPIPPAIGASLALEGTGNRTGRSRLALVAAIVAVGAVIGALTLVHAIDDVAAHPQRTGASWDLVVSDTGSDGDAEVEATFRRDPDVAALAVASRVPTDVGGANAPVYAIRDLFGHTEFTVVDGHAPTRPGEIALGPATARLLGASLGDDVPVGPGALSMRVVGFVLLSQEPHTSFDEGAWVGESDFETIHASTGMAEFFDEGFVTLVPGADAESVAARLPPGWYVTPPARSSDLANLLRVRDLPIFLALFLGLLGLGAVAHTLFSGARERIRELAVFRALGLSARQAGAAVSWQALSVGLIALAVGMPAGVVVGRRLWRAITEQLSFVYIGPWAVTLLMIVGLLCLAGCLLLAVAPALDASRRRVGDALREE